jgi:hypothetical protein
MPPFFSFWGLGKIFGLFFWAASPMPIAPQAANVRLSPSCALPVSKPKAGLRPEVIPWTPKGGRKSLQDFSAKLMQRGRL